MRLALLVLLAAATCAHPIAQSQEDDDKQRELAEGRIFPGLLCGPCMELLAPLQDIWSDLNFDTCLEFIVQQICIVLKIEDKAVCNGIVNVYGPVSIYILSQTAGSPQGLCNIILEGSCGDINGDWDVTLPGAKPNVSVLPDVPDNAPKMRVLHLADLHVDPWYAEGAAVNCVEPLCCRQGVAADGNAVAAGPWGAPLSHCDVPQKTIDHLLQHIADTHKDIDAILWTGDLEPHDLWLDNKNKTMHALTKLTNELQVYFPNTTIFPAVGNHEGIPPNMFAPNDAPQQFSHDWLYDTLLYNWRPFIHESVDVADTVRYRASYMVRPWKGLRVISINTMYSYTLNLWLYINQNDPDGILSWLTEQLSYAEKAGDKVWIFGHIPPGRQDVLKYYSRNFNNIVNRFESTIRALIFGHTHQDEFQIFYDTHEPSGRPTAVAYVGPSVTTFAGNNPAYRIYDMDVGRPDQTWTVANVETYWADLSKTLDGTPPDWQLEYNTKEAYDMQQLYPADWNALTDRMLTNSSLIDAYNRYYYRLPEFETCDAACANATVCEMRKSDSNLSCPKADQPPPHYDGPTKFDDDVLRQIKLKCPVRP